jgi:choline dehydrogenase-like flavoprotein
VLEYSGGLQRLPKQAGTNQKVHHVARGKLLGGSSGINFLAYCRPSAEDIDYWAELGNDGWSWAELAPYYHRSESIDEGSSKKASGKQGFYSEEAQSHGHSGPIKTSFPPWTVPIEDSIIDAFDKTSGVPRPNDPWSGNHLGFYGALSVIDRDNKATRSYGATGYLAPNIHRKNLKVLTGATVSKILLDKTTARGVEFWRDGAFHNVFTTTEVILSASTVQSPRLLELSGIGDPDVLRTAGIDCVVPLPEVGNNLQEHPMTAATYELAPGEISLDSLFKDQALFQEHQRLYMEEHSGAMAGAMSVVGFLPYATLVSEQELGKLVSEVTACSLQLSEQESQNIMAHLRSPKSAAVQFTGVPANFDLKFGHADQSKLMPGAPPDRNACYTVLVSVNYPLSRGNSHVISPDPFAAPQIDLALLSHPVDASVLASGLRFVDRAFQSSQVKGKISGRVDPAPEIDLEDLERGRAFVRDRTMVYNHILGTCALGRVVDERLRVKGVRGLRVVDASVIPASLSGNIMSTVYALAEKAADMIKEDRIVYG